MAISFVQVTSGVSGNASLTVQITITGVTQGNTILIPFFHENFSNNGVSISAADGQGSYTLDNRLDRANTYTVGVFRLNNANAGSHTVTLTSTSGTAANNFWRCVALEYSGISTTALDQVGHAQNASSTGPLSATTGAPLASTGDLVLAIAFAESGTSGWATPSGYTQRYKDSSFGVAELLPSAVTTAITSNFGSLSSAAGWDVVVNTYSVGGTNYNLSISELAVPIVYEPVTLVYSQPTSYLLLVNPAIVPVLMAPAFADYVIGVSELPVPIVYPNVSFTYTPAGAASGSRQTLTILTGIRI